ncbi:MAG: CHAD domain-containing protein, partial [Miltoncostaeaceae bacterium]
YLLEIFAVAFDADLKPYLSTVKDLQDILGEIHDRDVQVPMLLDHLEWLDEREAMAVRRNVAEAMAAGEVAPRRRRPTERAYREFRERLEVGMRADERIGVHALIARRRRERDDLHRRFLDEWRRLKHERFRRSLEAALGISRD